MKIAVIGTGYVGLVTGTCFADSGNDVTCVDIDPAKIDMLNRGEVPIYEPGLAELVEHNAAADRLHFTTDLASAIKPAQVVFLAVGTPQSDNGSADLSALWSVVDGIAPHLRTDAIVVTKSTVPVGTNAKVFARLKEQTGREVRRGQQSRVPQGRRGDRRLHEARPRGGRRAAARSVATCCSSSTSRFCGPRSRSW